MRKIFIITAIILSPLMANAQSNEASLGFTAIDKGSLALTVRSDLQSVNAVGIQVKFDPRDVRITKLDLSKSFCDLFVTKTFDNNTGTIDISCGKPNPGIQGEAIIAIVNFQRLNNLKTAFDYLDDSQILANDGLGTNILGHSSVYLIKELQTSPTAEVVMPDPIIESAEIINSANIYIDYLPGFSQIANIA